MAETSHHHGNDWYQFTPAEAEVFGIDDEKWPKMLKAWQVYEAFKGINSDGARGYDIAALRSKYPQWLTTRAGRPETDAEEFSAFASSVVGLGPREAMAVYWKHHFWLIRRGIITFKGG